MNFIKKLFCKHKNSEVICWHWTHGPIDDSRIASAAEVMQYFTAVMRGEVKDQFGLDAPLAERTKAAVELAKRKVDVSQKTDVGGIVIVNNIPRPIKKKND